jgi:hypothetical protein
VNAFASRNMARTFLPTFRVQQRCGNIFPRNSAERLAGATDMSHKCWGCGYDPDQTGTDPEIGGDCRRGNTGTANQTASDGTVITDASGYYVSCAYTAQDCKARGMYSQDSSSRATGRFTGDTWMPAERETLSKSYIQGKTVPVLQMRNDAAYQQHYPMIGGYQWVKPVVLNVVADGNSTRFEAVLCQDEVGPDAIIQVVVNGTIVPRNYSGTNIDPLFRWNWFGDTALGTAYHTGTRNGVATKDSPWNQNGDPHGSLAGIEVVVYSQVAQAGSVPDVKVLLRGPRATIWWPIQSAVNNVITFPFKNDLCAGNPPYVVTVSGCSLTGVNGTWPLSNWTYGPPGTITLSGCSATGSGSGGWVQFKAPTANPMHWLVELLIWSNWRYSELDLLAFATESQYCDSTVSYTNLSGASASHARFKAQFALTERRSADDAVKALLLCCNAQLRRDPQTASSAERRSVSANCALKRAWLADAPLRFV